MKDETNSYENPTVMGNGKNAYRYIADGEYLLIKADTEKEADEIWADYMKIFKGEIVG